MRAMFLTTFCAAVLGLTASAGEVPRSCCAKPRAEAGLVSASKMRCSITAKVVDKCCCLQKEGKTYCTLAKRAVESCCCSPVDDAVQPSQPRR